MNGKLTGIVLGAGASYCYSGHENGIPTQQDLVGRLFFNGQTSDGEGFPSFTDTFGMRHSFPLAQYLRERFEIHEDPNVPMSKMDFWKVLQSKGYNLETLYAAIEEDSKARGLLDDFESIVRAAVLSPTNGRGVERACEHHRRLCEALEPGDYIIDFNWDSVMSDALLHYSHLWFPTTGFGVPVHGSLLRRSQKSHPIRSLVTLLHIHGSACLFEPLEQPALPGVLYVGPSQWSTANGILAIMGNAPGDQNPQMHRQFTPEEEDRVAKGWVVLDEQWFRPVFVPPSRHKPHYENWYCLEVRRRIHSLLPDTQRLIFAGYSFPPADVDYLRQIFVGDVVARDLFVDVVNPENDDQAFRARVTRALPFASANFRVPDFRALCEGLSGTAF